MGFNGSLANGHGSRMMLENSVQVVTMLGRQETALYLWGATPLMDLQKRQAGLTLGDGEHSQSATRFPPSDVIILRMRNL